MSNIKINFINTEFGKVQIGNNNTMIISNSLGVKETFVKCAYCNSDKKINEVCPSCGAKKDKK